VAAGDGVVMDMSENVAVVLAHIVDRLIKFLEHNEVERGPSADKVRRRMFPDAYRDRAEARAFRDLVAAIIRGWSASSAAPAPSWPERRR
jgi:hypothetical protein